MRGGFKRSLACRCDLDHAGRGASCQDRLHVENADLPSSCYQSSAVAEGCDSACEGSLVKRRGT